MSSTFVARCVVETETPGVCEMGAIGPTLASVIWKVRMLCMGRDLNMVGAIHELDPEAGLIHLDEFSERASFSCHEGSLEFAIDGAFPVPAEEL